MISDEVLERLLRDAATSFDPPADGPANVLSAARPRSTARLTSAAPAGRRRRGARLVAAAAALVAVSAIGGALLTSRAEPRRVPTTISAGSAPSSAPNRLAERAPARGPDARPPAPVPAAGQGLSLDPSGGASLQRSATTKAMSPVAPPADSARIVKTGSVSLEVAKRQVPPTLDRLTTLAAGQGGYVASSSTAEGSSRPSGSVRLRVPAGSFEATLREVRGYGTVQSVSVTGRDVTATYVDLAARLRALQATRSTYLTLLARARTIGETLAVQQQVDGVQQQIESFEGQRKVLADSSDLATLDVRVAEKGTAAAVVPPREQSGLERAFGRALHGFARGIYAIIAASGPALLLLLCLLVLLAMSWVGYRMLRRRLV